MRAALAYLVGCAGSAPGREIPVYREYTVPIAFADGAGGGQTATEAAAAPDLVVLRSIRDEQAREAMVGKETLLGLAFVGGSSVFGGQAPLPGKMSPPAGGDDTRQRRNKESGQNWLVKSLSLPSLGQATSNAATSALSVDEKPSGWGWLVDEVARSSDGGTDAQEEELPDAEESNPFLRDRAASSEQEGQDDLLSGRSVPREDAAGQDDRFSPNRNALSGQEPERSDQPQPGRADFSAPKDYRVSFDAAAGMSQTRSLIAEISGDSRIDFASLRESLVGVSADKSGLEEPVPISRMELDLPSRVGRSAGNGSDPAAFEFTQSPRTEAAWQGGWNTPGSSVLPLLGEPSSTVLPPPASAGTSRPDIPSGGYKPAWY